MLKSEFINIVEQKDCNYNSFSLKHNGLKLTSMVSPSEEKIERMTS